MPSPRDAHDVLVAIERLHFKHKLITLEQARLAARLVTGEDVTFPLPRPEKPAEPVADAPQAEPKEGETRTEESASPE